MKLTELERTILLVFLVFSKKKEKFLDESFICSKFTRRQRSLVRRFIKRLEKEKLIIKHPEGYKLSRKGLNEALKTLHEGVKLWKR